MTRTTLLKNENYLAITTIISVGVLSGCEYCSPVLAVLLIIPVVKLLIKKIISNHPQSGWYDESPWKGLL